MSARRAKLGKNQQQQTTYGKAHSASRMVTLPMTSRKPKGRRRDPDVFGLQYRLYKSFGDTVSVPMEHL